MGPKAGEPVSIFLPPGSAEPQPGCYHAFGSIASDLNDHERTLRFYWNASAESAVSLVEAVTREFNRFQMAFHFKSGTAPLIIRAAMRQCSMFALAITP